MKEFFLWIVALIEKRETDTEVALDNEILFGRLKDG